MANTPSRRLGDGDDDGEEEEEEEKEDKNEEISSRESRRVAGPFTGPGAGARAGAGVHHPPFFIGGVSEAELGLRLDGRAPVRARWARVGRMNVLRADITRGETDAGPPED